ncbi:MULTISPECIES: DUF2480 family protein [Dokdonia]|uniref:DUF2480 family protein n=1 Tax=Dokdonia TaxID=326319 RepID=UPI000068BFEE|nr:DUF2480 family protein [Dokdonia sp. MED134]AOE06406.1 conserved hypothetical protein [uncultured bacterium]EAQ38220.1 hypothetical protein MED134_11000 [Dokdonia sp. MED134]
MAEEIINRVANSKLITFDLEDLYRPGNRQLVDISQWLDQGFILRESEFRKSIKEHDWSQYTNAFVALHCSTDAIVPAWAYMLVTTHMQGIAKKVITGDLALLETILYTEIIQGIDVTPYENLPVIVKGCSNKPVPENAYLLLIEKLQPVARSLMFGEACSSVPLYKKAK